MKNTEAFTSEGWRAESLPVLFKNLEDHLNQIPQEERWNLFYTQHHSVAAKSRPFERMETLAFDIDKIPGFEATPEQVDSIFKTVCGVLDVSPLQTACVCSGNGVHVLVQLTERFQVTDPDFFSRNKHHYAAICARITGALQGEFPGAKADTAIFDRSRILRLPGTLNRKQKDGHLQEKPAFLHQRNLEPQDFDLTQRSGVFDAEPEDVVPDSALKYAPAIDTKSVLNGCKFLAYAKDEAKSLPEPEWYAALSILARLDEGHKLAHEFSSQHRSYSKAETDAKFEQAISQAGPRTCKNVDALWGKCKACPHFGKVASPVMIKGDDFIATEKTGFHFIGMDKDGKPRVGKPDYEGLRRFYKRKQPYIVMRESESMYHWMGTHWEEGYKSDLRHFAQENFRPMPDSNKVNEFTNLVLRTEIRAQKWMEDTTKRRMNLANGVLDIDTLALVPHSTDYGFKSVVPYNYDPLAKAPVFEKFMQDVTCGNKDIHEMLLQFMGYSLSNDACWEHKTLILKGEGRNGKSTLMEILKKLVGKKGYTALTMPELENPANRYLLDGALFNMAEETPSRSFLDSALFKNLVSGGSVQVKQLYQQPYMLEPRAKFWFSCNEAPKFSDFTTAMLQRLVIVPFEATFVGEKADKHIGAKLEKELPGILNLVISAYRRMMAAQGLVTTNATEEALRAYQLENDNAFRWWTANVEVVSYTQHPDVFIPCKDLFSRYCVDMEMEKEKVLTKEGFFKRLSTRVPHYESRRSRTRNEGHIIRGVRFLTGDSGKF